MRSVTTADGYAEREVAKALIADARQVAGETAEITLGADKGYDAQEFIAALIELNVIPHVAQNTSHRRSAVPDDIAGSDGYAISQQKRKLIEHGFGWAKFIGPIRQVMVRGLEKVDQLFVLTMAAYNLTRMRSLGATVPQYRYSGATRDDFAAKNAVARAALEKFGELPLDVLEGTRRSRFAPPIARRGTRPDAPVADALDSGIADGAGNAARQDDEGANA